VNGAQVVLEGLRRHGVDTVFGHPGGATLPIYDALYDGGIAHILVRHEQAGAHMADAVFRTTGRPGVVIATSGPGATNLVTGLATAQMDSSALVAITGNVARPLLGTDAFQEADIAGITIPVTKHNYLVQDPDDLARIIDEAFHIAVSGRPGPVLIDIPKDVQLAPVDPVWPASVDPDVDRPLPAPDPAALAQAAGWVAGARRPVLMVGGGAQTAYREVLALAEGTGLPVITTLNGLGAFPGGHPQWLGMPGMHGTVAANRALIECDLILAIGLRFDDRVTGKVNRFAPNARVIHVDIDRAEISKLVFAHCGIVSDSATAARALLDLAPRPAIGEWWTTLDDIRRKHPDTARPTAAPLSTPEVIQAVHRATGGECIVTTEVGQHQMYAARYFPVSRPRRFITSGGLGTMGFGFPAAIGAQIANPGETVICFAGDGSFQMNIQELATLTRYQVPVKVVVLNNQALGMVRQWQEMFNDERYSEVDLAPCNPDFVRLAEAYGVAGARCDSRESVESAVATLLGTPGPALLDCRVDRVEKVFPMIPAGRGIEDMIVGDEAEHQYRAGDPVGRARIGARRQP
jgi:acetolactate synthase-1/2/3 large subunit